ncbi:MAG: 50S ribosomal protein L35 [Patescibacteria group bacterium]|nr:50S ribosomal protein L35 [Patescibacteria group bacterium]MBU2509634.1 50S ribosomal protein L35 [Patescibacteria group bacterium]
MKLKTTKSISKRIKITKTGKLLKRYGGKNHFNSRDPGKITRKKRRDTTVSPAYAKTLIKALPNK